MKYNITPKEVYDLLKSNEELLNIYKKIEEIESQAEYGWAFHNFEHVKSVSMIAEKILRDLKYNENTIYVSKIACLLHDVGLVQGRENHEKNSYIYAKKLFEDNNWVFEGMDDVLDAIKNHRSSFDNDKIVTLSIIIGDKLDIKKTRISKRGLEIEGIREYYHIEDIIIKIEKNIFTVNFKTDGKINIKEANEFYFTPKVFKAIEAFSKKLNFNYSILLDGEAWII